MSAHLHAAFQQFLDALPRPLIPATVEAQTDPKFPGRTVYRITGKTWLAVNIEISRLEESVDAFTGEPGRALFIGPYQLWNRSGYAAIGEVVKEKS